MHERGEARMRGDERKGLKRGGSWMSDGPARSEPRVNPRRNGSRQVAWCSGARAFSHSLYSINWLALASTFTGQSSLCRQEANALPRSLWQSLSAR